MKPEQKTFARILPEVTRISEKPMAQWASGKIKRIYDGYASFCEEIERLLGEPQQQLPQEKQLKPHVAHQNSPELFDEFDQFWQPAASAEENGLQLLTLLSGFYKAGFVLSSAAERTRITGYFADDGLAERRHLLAAPFERLVPEIKSESDLKPIPLSVQPIIDRLGLQNLGWQEDFAVHFWLDPEKSLSLVVIADAKESSKEKTKQILYKTHSLIQRRFYD